MGTTDKQLDPQAEALVQRVMAANPRLRRPEAIAQLKAFGGL
jgi:hypothetical protein